MGERHRLYGGEISYYSGKVRSYLRRKAIPFEEIQATRAVYKDVILPRVGWPVIPVVVTPEDETLQDTTEIIDALEARFPAPSVYPTGPRQRLVALLLEVYGDEWLKIPAMHYRWNHNTDWIIEQFGRLSNPDASPAEARAIGERTCRPFRGALPPLGVDEATIPAIEASYEGLLGELDAHFARHAYLLGDRPCIGDFGLIGPLYAHQFRDPASGALMRRLAPNVVTWVERMLAESDGRPTEGAFLADDAVPETLLPVLRRMVDEQFPVLDAELAAFDAWADGQADAQPDAEIPRALGMHAFTLGRGTELEVTSERACFTFDLWMFQRPRDFLAGLAGAERAACDALLARLGGPGPLTRPARNRLARRHFRLVRAA